MELIVGLLIIACIYLWLLFMDVFFKSCSHHGYIHFLKGTGFEIKFLQIRWRTTAFNTLLLKWGRSKLLTYWFNFGLFASLTILPISIYLLFAAFLQNFTLSSENLLEPVVPGLNLPASELSYYSFTLLLSSILHEMGHALAAVQEDVPLVNVGAHVLFVLPVAYVNLNSDKLFLLQPWKRLKILCAGVWHNIVVAFVAYLLLVSLPFLLSPFFYHNNGILVHGFAKNSPLRGEKGLDVYDKILRINDCYLNSDDSWFTCISKARLYKAAFCVESRLVHELDESTNSRYIDGVVSCCGDDDKGNLCFEHLESGNEGIEMPPYVCLPGRSVIESSKVLCAYEPHMCVKGTYCFRPVLQNHTNLFRIVIEHKNDVLYIGLASDLTTTVTVTSFTPKYNFLNTNIPIVTKKLLNYLVMFSMGLAIINILPCIFMDGQHIINTLFLLLFNNRLRMRHVKVISAFVTAFFSLLLIVHCFVVIYSKIK